MSSLTRLASPPEPPKPPAETDPELFAPTIASPQVADRKALLGRLATELERTLERAEPGSALIVIGLDRFKAVNGVHGYAAGDDALMEITRRVQRANRQQGLFVRLGGDEFALMATGLRHVAQARRLATEIHRALRWPMRLAGRRVTLTASTGIAWIDESYTRADDVLRDAEIALARAKANGRDRSELFDVARHGSSVEMLQIEADLKEAIERGELRLHYQPIVELVSGHLRGFEALVRWHHPRRGLLRPKEFIALASTLGLMPALGEWTLERSCYQLAGWQRRFPRQRWTMSVNVDFQHLTAPGFLDQIERVLRQSQLAPESLVLELTETAMIAGSEEATEVLLQLRERGVEIHVDDFGTGYSSLSYLHQVPTQAIKVDASFVTRMPHDERHRKIVKGIVHLAHDLGLEVVAEGVETEPQWNALRQLGCDYGQGFYFSRPIDPESLEDLIVSGAL